MIRLSLTTHKLQAALAGAVATTQPRAYVTWTDTNNEGRQTPGGTQMTALNSATDVDICAAPQQNYVRNIDHVSITNIDTAAIVLTVKIDVSGTDTRIDTQTLAVGETWRYESGAGCQVTGP